MGYKKTGGGLADLWPSDEWLRETNRDLTQTAGDELREEVRHRTPMADVPEAYKGDRGEFIADRGGRVPGTMREGWYSTEAEVTTDGGEVKVDNEDDKTIFVEEDTRPHLIRAGRRDDGSPGALRFPDGPIFRYAHSVHHPGTQGVHMMRDAEAEIDATWDRTGQRIVDRRLKEAMR